jgi:hypothetical protein
MSGMTPFPLIAGAANPGHRLPLARVEKTSASSSLHNGEAPEEQHRQAEPRESSRPALSRSGTTTAPRWNAPRWSAPFVAQILGQVLAHPAPDAVSARAAYARAKRLQGGQNFDQNV